MRVGYLPYFICLKYVTKHKRSFLIPLADLSRFWHFVYRTLSLTYFIDGLVIAVLANTAVEGLSVEMLHILPPKELSCGSFFKLWIDVASGYWESSDTTHDWAYCPLS